MDEESRKMLLKRKKSELIEMLEGRLVVSEPEGTFLNMSWAAIYFRAVLEGGKKPERGGVVLRLDVS